MAGALEDCLVVAGGLEAVEPKRKVGFGKNMIRKKQEMKCFFHDLIYIRQQKLIQIFTATGTAQQAECTLNGIEKTFNSTFSR